MKYIYKYLLLVISFVILISCQKNEEVMQITNFDVTTTSVKYKVGEQVIFNITGMADIISFYSGEENKDYNYRNGRKVKIDSLKMSFNNAVIYGTQPDQLSIMLSTDFNGRFNDFLSVDSADWVNITDKFNFSTNYNFISSGIVNVTNFREEKKPVFFAFKYLTRPQLLNGDARTWRIEKFTLSANTEIGVYTISSDFVVDGFQIIDQSPLTAPAKSTISSSRITLLGNSYDANLDPQTENWAVSKAFYVDSVDVGRSYSIPVKGIADGVRNSFEYTYLKPGIYTATFVATNVNIYNSKSQVKHLEIVIEE